MECAITSKLFSYERFRASCCIWPANFKKPTILPEVVGFLKVVAEIQQ